MGDGRLKFKRHAGPTFVLDQVLTPARIVADIAEQLLREIDFRIETDRDAISV